MTSREVYEMFMTPPKMAPRARREQELLDRGAQLELRVFGQKVVGHGWGEGPSVLVQHGWGSRATAMWAIIKQLVSDGYQVFAFDAPGNGDSEGTRSSMFQFAETIRSASEVHGPFKAIVSHSIGATAVPFAVSQGARAEKVVLMSARNELEDFLKRFFEQASIDGSQYHQEVQQHWADEFGWDSVLNATPSRLAPHLTQKALIIHDQDDEDISVQEGHDLHTAWPGSRLVVTSGLGHTRIVRSAEVAQQISDFIQS